MKICTKCKVEKDESMFYRTYTRKTAFSWWCRDCVRKYNSNNKDKIKKRKANYYVKNKDKINEYGANYRANNKDKNRERMASYREANRDKIRERSASDRKNLEKKYLIVLIRHKSTLKVKDIPAELIEAKRMQMLINRTIKEHQK